MQKLKKLFPLVGALLALALVSCGSDSDDDSKTAGSISYATTSVEKTTADEAFTNSLTKTGDGTVSYASSKTDVAEVNTQTGLVTIKGAGETTITATVADSESYTYAVKTASYTLTVTAADTTPQKTAGSISYATATVSKTTDDEPFTNELTKTGDGTVSYASDNTAVATVYSDGLVTIFGTGTATITATVEDSDTYTYATKTASYTLTVTYIGTKAPSEAKAVGDIVFSDGSATPYTSELTNEQKSKAVAVIFYAGSAEDVLGAKTLGVGLKNTGTDNYLAWAKDDDVNGYSTNITAIQCEPRREEAATATFTGDTDGSDNWKALCDAVSDEDTSGNYPAWEWVNAYATTANLPDNYASGWYLPTVAELSMLYRVKDTVNSALEKAGGTKIADETYWSSSQNDFYNNYAFGVGFDDGYIFIKYKDAVDSVCTVRAFSGTDAPKATAIGIKSKPDAVGDIVFNDGSATPYTADLTLTDEQKAAAIALIFYVGTDCSNDSTSRTLGVGLVQNQSGLAWCLDSAKAYSWDIDTIQCTASGSAGNLTFTGDRNGSDNLSQISDFLLSKATAADDDDTASAASYPAFYFAENYKSQTGSRVSGTDYESGWYLPSIAELFQIWTQRIVLNKAITLCAGTGFNLSGYYWSSSQFASVDTKASYLDFINGDWRYYGKHYTGNSVCAVRAF